MLLPRRRAPLTCLILALFSSSTAGCVSTRPLVTTLAALRCADLIPPDYRQQVAGTPLLRPGATVADLGAALDGQTAKLDQANGRTADVIRIADACQAQQDKVLQTLAPKPWWRFWD